MKYVYYRFKCDHRGLHYFRVKKIKGEPTPLVVKITIGTQPKKGRPFCVGITLIKYITFISSYGWKMESEEWNNSIKEITEAEYNKAFELLMKKLK